MKRVALAVFLASASLAYADESQLWIVATVRSYHMDRSSPYNERNYGPGIEYAINSRWSVAAGEYWNSSLRLSKYVAGSWTPVSLGAVRLGSTAGVVTGYNRGHLAPLVAGVATIEGKRYGANLLAIPPYDGGNWVLALQIKRRF
ncbi:MAG: hypothetical protein A3E01_08330 [Gammaproteobacteria bacterium RIFCSPHIGHO2_12_FULL_63_22]|nr:MAG: hypothetical protein A3E01_08330 [Gammaproteobacteria bacterium RIFCSPHIGHO2_12_FULL_63_22]